MWVITPFAAAPQYFMRAWLCGRAACLPVVDGVCFSPQREPCIILAGATTSGGKIDQFHWPTWRRHLPVGRHQSAKFPKAERMQCMGSTKNCNSEEGGEASMNYDALLLAKMQMQEKIAFLRSLVHLWKRLPIQTLPVRASMEQICGSVQANTGSCNFGNKSLCDSDANCMCKSRGKMNLQTPPENPWENWLKTWCHMVRVLTVLLPRKLLLWPLHCLNVTKACQHFLKNSPAKD